MVDNKYIGRGKSPEVAQKDLYVTASKNGMDVKAVESVEYTAVVRGVRGAPNADYGMAFASALDEAKVPIAEFKLNELEVEVCGVFAPLKKVVEKSAARPSGAGPSGSRNPTLTDLL